MLESVALVVVLLAGLYLIVLGVVSLRLPQHGARFLLGFVGSAAKHYLELGLRLIAGIAFVVRADAMALPQVFTAFGWLLLIGTLGLLAVPWRWHQRFARRAVPLALRFLWLVALASIAFGGFVLVCAMRGIAY